MKIETQLLLLKCSFLFIAGIWITCWFYNEFVPDVHVWYYTPIWFTSAFILVSFWGYAIYILMRFIENGRS